MYVCLKCSARYPVYTPWCTACLTDRMVVLEPSLPAAAMRSELQVSSARELVKRKWSTLESKAYPALVLSKGALVAVWGPPGAGKSTFATRYVDGLVRPIVYFSAEEKLGPTLAARLERCGVTRADFHVVGQGSIDAVCAMSTNVDAVALVLDSVSMTTIQPGDLRRLLEAAGVDVVLFLLHATKDGQAAGSMAFLHEADVIVELETMRWRASKSRYQQTDGTRHPVL